MRASRRSPPALGAVAAIYATDDRYTDDVHYTGGALRGLETGCLLTVSDIIVEGEFTRISDEALRAAVDQMTELALGTVTAGA